MDAEPVYAEQLVVMIVLLFVLQLVLVLVQVDVVHLVQADVHQIVLVTALNNLVEVVAEDHFLVQFNADLIVLHLAV